MAFRRGSRMDRERETLDRMIRIYCAARHGGRGGLCADCAVLRSYAHRKLDRCPFQAGKPTCARCTVHCYRREMRERVREVMRFAGPRMALRHPWLSLLHFLDPFRRSPPGPDPR